MNSANAPLDTAQVSSTPYVPPHLQQGSNNGQSTNQDGDMNQSSNSNPKQRYDTRRGGNNNNQHQRNQNNNFENRNNNNNGGNYRQGNQQQRPNNGYNNNRNNNGGYQGRNNNNNNNQGGYQKNNNNNNNNTMNRAQQSSRFNNLDDSQSSQPSQQQPQQQQQQPETTSFQSSQSDYSGKFSSQYKSGQQPSTDDNNQQQQQQQSSNYTNDNTYSSSYNRNSSYGGNKRPQAPRMHTCGGPSDPEAEKALFGEARTGIDFTSYDGVPANATGEKVPKAITTFQDIQFGDHVEGNLKLCGYERPTPIQKFSLPIAMAQRDMIACAQTGSGKTAAFLLPIVNRLLQSEIAQPSSYRCQTPQALILGPTRELVTQIYKEATKFTYRTSIKPVVVYGGIPIYEQLQSLQQGCNLLVATPGRLQDLCDRGKVSLKHIQMLIFDEADCMLDMGFQPQIEALMTRFDMPSEGRQTLMFSATFPPEIQRLAASYLTNYVYVTIGRVGSATSLVTQKLIPSPMSEEGKRDQLLTLLNGCDGLTLIFVETKRSADLLEQFLVDNDINAASIHGDRTQHEREQALSFFKSGHCPVLVATDVASRGLSIPNVEYVINYDMPAMIDDYVHRIGRTGRCGARGIATSFISERNKGIASDLLDNMKEAKQAIPEFLQALVDSTRSGYSNYGGYNSYRGGNQGGYGNNNRGGYKPGQPARNTNYGNQDVRYSQPASNSNPLYGGTTSNTKKPVAVQTVKSFAPSSAVTPQNTNYGNSSSVLNSVQVSDDAW